MILTGRTAAPVTPQPARLRSHDGRVLWSEKVDLLRVA
jgi:hypothetical protein